MPVRPVAPFVLKDVTFTVGVDDYKHHVSKVLFTPTTSSATWKGLGGQAHSDQGMATWACTISLAQDWTPDTGLARYLFDREGQTRTVTFVPKAGGPTFTVTLTIAAPSIGGDVDTYQVSEVTMPCAAKPVVTPADATITTTD